jgi:nucleoside-diphosphate-sugar epimerase
LSAPTGDASIHTQERPTRQRANRAGYWQKLAPEASRTAALCHSDGGLLLHIADRYHLGPMNVTLTGAGGRLGSRVCRALVAAGHTVRATDRAANRSLPVAVEIANLLDRTVPYRLVDGADVVVHVANHPYILAAEPYRVLSENVTMNTNVFQAACDCGVRKIVYTSSVQAFGGPSVGDSWERPSNLPYLPVDGDVPANPGQEYALSKAMGEAMLAYCCKRYALDAVALRFPHLSGPGFDQRRHRMHYGAMLDEAFTYLSFEDAARLVELCVRLELPGYRVYFPARPDNIPQRPAREMIEQYYRDVPLRRPIEQIDSLVDLSRIKCQTGWEPSPEPPR